MPSAHLDFVRRTLRRAVLLPVIGAALIVVVFLIMIQRLLWESDRLNQSEEVITTAEQVRQLAVDMETGVRGYLLSNDRSFLEPYDRSSRAFAPLLVRLDGLVADNPSKRHRVKLIAADVAEWQRHADQMIRSRAVKQELAVGKSLMDRAQTDFAEFLEAERALSIERARRVRTTTVSVVLITILLAAIAATVLVIFIRRDLRDLSQRYESALESSEHVAAVKDRLLASVSHELRTPLTSILGWSTLLRSHGADAETTRLALASIEQSARLQSRLVEDLIDVSRATAGKLRVEMAEIDLRQVLHLALETIKPAADAKGVTVSHSIGDEGLWILGDATRLQQVVGNLMSNSVRFTPAGGDINMMASRHNGYAEVSVRDTGAGIDRDFLPHVFEPFAQEREASQRSMGLGLGLAISRRIVELHGGTIEARSDGPGHGAEFTVRFPIVARTTA